MSFYTRIQPRLNKQDIGDELDASMYYVNILRDSLNEWFDELKNAWYMPVFKISGTGVLGNSTITVKDVPCMRLVSKKIKFNSIEIRSALRSATENATTEIEMKDGARKGFENLFRLIGEKITQNWTTIIGNNIVFSGSSVSPIFLNTSYFYMYGSLLYANVQNPGMNPELFHSLFNAYLLKAINSIPITFAAIKGRFSPAYVFVGTVKIKLPVAGL